MGVEMKKGSKWWYGRFRDGKKIRQVSLGVEIKGKRPARTSEKGDRKFEKSRQDALLEFRNVTSKLKGDYIQERAVQQLAEIKTGKKIEFPQLKDLPEMWANISRRGTPSEQYTDQCKGILGCFVKFVEKEQPSAKDFVSVTPETAQDFMESEKKFARGGRSPKTWNDSLKLLRTTFKKLHPSLTDGSNPFRGLVTKSTKTINREPYTEEDLRYILEASKKHPFIRPLIIIGMCTAMRRGDCCNLRWNDVDLEAEFITVKTSKTGETVDIPMFPMLKGTLKSEQKKAQAALPSPKLGSQKDPAGFVFPELAAMYQKKPDSITKKVKDVISDAFYQKAVDAGEAAPKVTPEEINRRAQKYMDGLGDVARVQRMREAFDSYMKDLKMREVADKMGKSKSTISNYLNEIESNIELSFIRGKVRKEQMDGMQKERSEGMRKASVRDFHSFRVTWITLALSAGVPLELVQRVTGHKTIDVVLKHYFRPGREDFRQGIMSAMPTLLSDPSQPKVIDVITEDDKEHQPERILSDNLDRALKALNKVTGKANQKRVAEAIEAITGS